jgi:hypothetical protein
MSIIDKLCITPIQRHCNKLLDIDVFSEHEIRKIEKQRNEMLEALIKDLLMTKMKVGARYVKIIHILFHVLSVSH